MMRQWTDWMKPRNTVKTAYGRVSNHEWLMKELGRLGTRFELRVNEGGEEAIFTDLPVHVDEEKQALEEQKKFNHVG